MLEVQCECRCYPEARLDLLHKPTGTIYRDANIHGDGGIARPARRARFYFMREVEKDPERIIRVYTLDTATESKSVRLLLRDCEIFMPKLTESANAQAPR